MSEGSLPCALLTHLRTALSFLPISLMLSIFKEKTVHTLMLAFSAPFVCLVLLQHLCKAGLETFPKALFGDFLGKILKLNYNTL